MRAAATSNVERDCHKDAGPPPTILPKRSLFRAHPRGELWLCHLTTPATHGVSRCAQVREAVRLLDGTRCLVASQRGFSGTEQKRNQCSLYKNSKRDEFGEPWPRRPELGLTARPTDKVK
jgi:hypothetical protein